VSQNYFLHGGIHIFHSAQDTLHITARIDDSGLARAQAFNDAAILLVCRYRHDSTLNGHDEL
jgi:hypothetical protein